MINLDQLATIATDLTERGLTGFTIRLDDQPNDVAGGFSVGGNPLCPEIRIGGVRGLPAHFVAEALRFYTEVATIYGDDQIGGWVHEGDLYIDAPTIYVDGDEAAATARERGELAIFDLNTMTEIFVN